jgi:hypothetical protein
MLSEVSQSQKDKGHVFLSYMEARSNANTSIIIYTYTYRTQMQIQALSYIHIHTEHVSNSGIVRED